MGQEPPKKGNCFFSSVQNGHEYFEEDIQYSLGGGTRSNHIFVENITSNFWFTFEEVNRFVFPIYEKDKCVEDSNQGFLKNTHLDMETLKWDFKLSSLLNSSCDEAESRWLIDRAQSQCVLFQESTPATKMFRMFGNVRESIWHFY